MSTSFGWEGNWQVWFIPLEDVRGVCREIPWERVPYLRALEVWSRQGAYESTFTFTLHLPITCTV